MPYGYSIYFTERRQNRVLRWDPDGGTCAVVAGEPTPGKDRGQFLSDPYGLAVSPTGQLFVADKFNNRICKLTSAGVDEFPLLDRGNTRGPLPESATNYVPTFFSPTGLFFDSKGTLLCSFSDDYTIYRISANGATELVLGVTRNHSIEFCGIQAEVPPLQVQQTALYAPTSVVQRQDGTIFFIERGYQEVRQYHPATGLRSVFPPSLYQPFSRVSQSPVEANLPDYHPSYPSGLTLDADDNLYLCDVRHHCILLIDFDKNKIRRVWATPGKSDKDGGPSALAFGPDGNAWVVDSGSNQVIGLIPNKRGEWRPSNKVLTEVKGRHLQFAIAGAGIVCFK